MPVIVDLSGTFEKRSDKFELGRLVTTSRLKSCMDADFNFAIEVFNSFSKYIEADWGDTYKEDWRINEYGMKNWGDILAKYHTSKGDIFISTVADKSSTTILFTDEW